MSSFQSFTGTARRPRQVNLSGRSTNPFAASSAVASAQQDRLNRQLQRERVQACSCIQRVWRGHSSRRKTFEEWRRVWDEIERSHGTKDGAYNSPEQSLKQFQRLMLFYRPPQDVERLTWYGMRQIATNDVSACRDGPWPDAYLSIARACLSALRQWTYSDEAEARTILTILGFAVRRTTLDQRDAVTYYEILTSLSGMPNDALQNALVAPLQDSPEGYVGLAVLLTRPLSDDMTALLRSVVDAKALVAALTRLPERFIDSSSSRLWLLGNTIFLAGQPRDLTLIKSISRLLGSLADEVDFEGQAIDQDNISFDQQTLQGYRAVLPMNTYLRDNVHSLIDQNTIRSLLSRSILGPGSDAHALAAYSLTLLRCFPKHADDIRMWLYLGPPKSDGLPATQYFWFASKQSDVFQNIHKSSRDVIPLVKAIQPDQEVTDNWTLILVFLELYTFLLKIMDDEEFMGVSTSGRRNSAIPIEDVAYLVTFLKNLGFTLYFNAAELNAEGDVPTRDANLHTLSRHFAKGSVPDAAISTETKPTTVAGIPGLTIDYLKGLVTGLLRAVYERDSRRNFLPADHWLMTSRIDMTTFISGVVLEEENRHSLQDDEDGDDGSDYETEEYQSADHMDSSFRSRNRQTALRSQAARVRAQQKTSHKRYLEKVAPRLEIVQNMPFLIPFTTRVEIFREFVLLDQVKRRNGHVDPDQWRASMMASMPHGMAPRGVLAPHHAKIRRKNEFADAFESFYNLGPALKEPIQIEFVDEFDIPEAGIDGGGVTKEFLTSVISQAFDPTDPHIEQPFFVENEKHLLYPSPTALEDLKLRWQAMGFKPNSVETRNEVRSLLQQYEFLGRIIGKCLYEDILVDVSFAGFFLKKWALTGGSNAAALESGYRANINDLRELDEGLYRGMLAVKNASPEELESFGLTFTVDELVGPEGSKQVVERELINNGANTPVTADNKLVYVNRMSWFKLQGQSAAQTNAFLRGISSVIEPGWLSMFNQSELQTLVAGAQADIDVADLRANTQYGGTYVIGDDARLHPSVELFWEVMSELPDEERRKVLKFVTSTPRGPLLGFNQLNPRFSIRDSGQDENRYPTTSTCVNLLKLPMYKEKKTLREKLLAAVNSGAGFDLS